MQASKLKPYQMALIDGVPIWLNEVEASGRSVTIKGRNWKGNIPVEVEVWDTDDIQLCNNDGITTEGRTLAEVNAYTAAKRLEGTNWVATVEITESYGYRHASLSVRSTLSYEESYFACWGTRIEGTGRKTTRFVVGLRYRSPFHSKRQKGNVKISQKEFYREMSWLVTREGYRKEREAAKAVTA